MRKRIVAPIVRCFYIALFMLVFLFSVSLMARCSERGKRRQNSEEQRQKNEIEQYHRAQGREVMFLEEIFNEKNNR